MSHRRFTSLVALALPIAACSSAGTETTAPVDNLGGALSANDGGVPPPIGACPGSGPIGNEPNKQAYFGDLHLHTSYSLDAFSHGTRTDPASAYAFAKTMNATISVGSATTAAKGPVITQTRPLDFLAVTDHSEFLSVTHGCLDKQSGYYTTKDCGLVRSTNAGTQETVFKTVNKIQKAVCAGKAGPCLAEERTAWKALWQAARDANDPCHFTSLVGYEWTDEDTVTVGGTSSNANDHHNVIFGSDTVPDTPIDAIAYPTPPALWKALDAWRTSAKECVADPGCDMVTIPHNSNLSAGISLQIWDPTPAGMALQSKYQVAAEVYQSKGASECYYNPAQGYSDPDCQFEQLGPDKIKVPGATNFVRTALKKGVDTAASPAGVNPLQLGIVGGTDNHNGSPGFVDEAKFVGHAGHEDDTAALRLTSSSDFSPGALTGVWARQNTRDEIFAAVKRRETFATSGPRITVRFLQISDQQKGLKVCDAMTLPMIVSGAVPMGGTFTPAAIGASHPRFALSVWPDAVPQELPDGTSRVANLAAVQIIKIRSKATTEELPIVVSGIAPTGGCTIWTDPSFDSGENAAYYVRVLQEPTWRWSHHDCVSLKGLKTQPAGCAAAGPLDVTIQERAWTSPIWYVPG